MALSVFLRTSLSRGTALRPITNQLLRSSSILATNASETRSFRPTGIISTENSIISKNNLLHSSTKPNQILAKYFAATQALKSDDGAAHDHVNIWKLERVLSIALLPLIPAALIAPNQVLDTLVAVIIVMHTHWGLEACVVDYVRPILFGQIGPKIGMGLLYIFSAVTLAGCLNLIFNDVGLANAFREIWKL